VVVVSVEEDSPAARAEIRPLNIITRIDNTLINSIETFDKAIDSLTPGQQASLKGYGLAEVKNKLIWRAATVKVTPTASPIALTENEGMVKHITLTEPNWRPMFDGATASYDANHSDYPARLRLNNDEELIGAEWEGHLKSFITALPREKQNTVFDGVCHCRTELDKVDKCIRFTLGSATALNFELLPEYLKSQVGLRGTMTPSKADALLVFNYFGSDSLFVKGVKVAIDDERIVIDQLQPIKQLSKGRVWERVAVNLANADHRAMAEKIAASKETIVRMQGEQAYSDFTVDATSKANISLMLKAIDTINAQ